MLLLQNNKHQIANGVYHERRSMLPTNGTISKNPKEFFLPVSMSSRGLARGSGGKDINNPPPLEKYQIGDAEKAKALPVRKTKIEDA